MPEAGAVLLPVTLTVGPTAGDGDAAGYVVLTQGTRTRRIPYWGHVERPHLAKASARLLSHPGIVRGSTRGQPNRVDSYRYPAYTRALGLAVHWRGGEALYRFHLAKRAINMGVTVEPISGGGLRPFVMRGLDENRVVGESGMPIDVGPSLTEDPVPSAGLYWAPAGDYAVSIDSARRRGGAFRLRFWMNDVTPPALGRMRVSDDARTAAHSGDGRGLGRRSALPRVCAGAAGLLDRQPVPSRLERSGGHRSHRRRAAGGRELCARSAGGGLRGVARRTRDLAQPAARAGRA